MKNNFFPQFSLTDFNSILHTPVLKQQIEALKI